MVSNEIGLDENADKIKYMVMSRDWNAVRSHNIKIYNSSFERMEGFKYLGTTLTYEVCLKSKCTDFPMDEQAK